MSEDPEISIVGTDPTLIKACQDYMRQKREPKPGEWVKCEQRSPANGQIVLVQLKSKRYFGQVCCAKYASQRFTSVPGAYGLTDVLCWQPLPAPLVKS